MRRATATLALMLCLAGLVAPGTAAAQAVEFGDDSGQYPRDAECDDRRFVGTGMAVVLNWRNTGRDASDCKALFDAGQIRLWVMGEALRATQCQAIDFGNDSGDYARDDECDDMRFEGPGMARGVTRENVGLDATDCLHHCRYGTIALRDYPVSDVEPQSLLVPPAPAVPRSGSEGGSERAGASR